MVDPDTDVRRARRFSWEEVPDELTRRILLDLYAGHEYKKERAQIRGASPVGLRATATKILGRPPRATNFGILTPILLNRWVPTLTADQVVNLVSLVGRGMNAQIRRESQQISSKKAALAFLDERRATATLNRAVCKEFIRQHKAILVKPRRTTAPDGPRRARVVLVGQGAVDERPPYRHTSQAWNGLDRLRRGRTRNGRSGLVVIPTGGGKTSTMVRWLLREMGQRSDLRVLWLADQRELVDQAAREFDRCGPQLPAGQRRIVRVVHSAGHPASTLVDAQVDIVCATRQSVIGRNFDASAKKRLRQYISDRPSVVVIDEAHHAVSPTYQALIAELWKADQPPLLVGLTATPFPSGFGMTALLRKTFPSNVVTVQTRDLVLNGDLAEPVAHSFETEVQIPLTPSERRQIQMRDVPDSVLAQLDSVRRNQITIETWLRYRATWGKTLVFAGNIEHADHLGEAFEASGVPTSVVHSRAEVELGEELKRFREASDARVLISVGMLLEGVDIPSARTAFLCRPTSSRVVMQQMVGRVLRGPQAGGDKVAHIVDLRDRWAQDLDILRPVDLAELPMERTPDAEDGADDMRRLPPVVAEDGETVIGEDLLASIARGVEERVRVWGQTATLTPTRLAGFYDLINVRIPVFEHTRAAWQSLGEEQARLNPSSRSKMGYFEDVAPPEPVERDVTAFVEYCRSQMQVPPFRELHARVDVRAVAKDLVALGAASEHDKMSWLRGQYEASLARSIFPSFQAYDEAVRTHVLLLLGVTKTGATPESFDEPETKPASILRRHARDLEPIFASAVARGRLLLEPEPAYSGLLDKEWLPQVEWTTRINRTTWAYFSWRKSSRAKDKPVIRVNLALQATRSQVPDELLEYLLWHELCHHLVPGRGHDSEFRRLEALWPDHLELDHQLDTLHERFAIPGSKGRRRG